MAFHCMTEGTDLADPAAHLAAGIEVLNDVLAKVPPEKIRYHVCWGNYRGPHHKDVALKDIVKLILKSRAKFIYVEAANPRHAHEWAVWKDVKLPDDKALIVGVIDTKTNSVEHPELVAERIEHFANIVGKERVIAATDCGFATFVGFHPCHPEAAWLNSKRWSRARSSLRSVCGERVARTTLRSIRATIINNVFAGSAAHPHFARYETRAAFPFYRTTGAC
jgi:Cobalamin-independent synthase, Catalytic domain